MITYTGRGGQARRLFDAAHLAGVPLRRPAPAIPFPSPASCAMCQDAGEVPRWSPEGGIFGDFLGMATCSCPAGAALAAEEEAAAIEAAGGEPPAAGDEEWPGF